MSGSTEALPQAVLAAYFVLIAACFLLVIKSAFSKASLPQAWETGSYVYVRNAAFALICTWYYMIRFLLWSKADFLKHAVNPTFTSWLKETSLFTQAWRVVCTSEGNWWWSKIICYWTVIYTVVMFAEGSKRKIRHLWAYMLLGQTVAISVSTALFLFAMASHPRVESRKSRLPITLWLPVLLAIVPIELTPYVVHTPYFLTNLLALHALLLMPFLAPSTKTASTTDKDSSGPSRTSLLYAVLSLAALLSQARSTYMLWNLRPNFPDFATHLVNKLFSHPAISSIGLDAIWVILTLVTWFVSTGTGLTKLLKMGAVATTVMGIAAVAGMDWKLLLSVIPIGIMAALAGIGLLLHTYRERNVKFRENLLRELGLDAAPARTRNGEKEQKTLIVGFWHPYCNAGGGGERVLWTAIAFLQRTEPRTVSLVYTGDYPLASKNAIINKVKERFGVNLNPKLLHLVPLPSREIISDTYWKRFTLLGQSLGSVALAWEGLCGAKGLWGDIFIDTMGYAFVLPLVRLVTGGNAPIGAYTHYPTVSTDMVERVRAGIKGHNNAGASGSNLRTRLKLVYYKIFTRLYSVALLFSSHTMTNSSWTQAHIQSLLLAGRSSTLASLITMDTTAMEKTKTPMPKCEVVYPPCDTAELVRLGKLDKRKRQIVSLAQFRPEKEHYKQLQALAKLFESHPQYRDDPAERVKLIMMGSVRGDADEMRLEGLKSLAKELGVQDNVEFVVNAPYPEIVRRLGDGSVGLNTMMDEHFGISIVEFMAAGLIPLVHASAGPMMDIVVPQNGEMTGLHGTTAESFASHLHVIFSMSASQQLKMRKAARARAVERFSEAKFEQGFSQGWEELKRGIKPVVEAQ